MFLQRKTRRLEAAIDQAQTYQEWKEAALAMDEHTGVTRWKRMDQSRRYDYVSIRTRLDRLRALRARGDNNGLLFTLNEGIHGNMGGMGKPSLYTKSRYGTKFLISDYVDEITSALEHLASEEVDEISYDDKLDFFSRASHCYGRSALMFSGAGTLGYFHLGVMDAMMEQGLLPEVLSGSSAGAIMCAIVGSRSEKEFRELVNSDQFFELIKDSLADESWFSLPESIEAGLAEEMIARLVPDVTFQEAFEISHRHINVSVAPSESHQTSRLLNAYTSPNVYVREALLASSAVPGFFPAVTLMAKNVDGDRQAYLPSRKWVDGSVSDDMPAKRLSRLYGVNHYIASQINPLVTPFISDRKTDHSLKGAVQRTGLSISKEIMGTGLEMAHRILDRNPKLSGVTHLLGMLVSQQYTGDINILPEKRFSSPLMLLSKRTEKETRALIDAGRRATWPKLEMIRIQTQISNCLDKILYEYDECNVNNHHRGPHHTRPKPPVRELHDAGDAVPGVA